MSGVSASKPSENLPRGTDELNIFFGDFSKLVECEFNFFAEDWTFLAEVNHRHAATFSELSASTDRMVASLAELKTECAELPKYFAEIDALDENLAILEAAAVKLDQYSRAVEKKLLVAR